MKHWKLAPLAIALLLGACKDTSDPEPEPDVASLRLTISGTGTAAQTVTVASNPGCAVTGGPISLSVNQPRTVTASFLNEAGQPDPVANDANAFRLSGNEGQQDPTPTPASITFTRTGGFSGTLTGTATTSGTVFLSLVHIEEGHEDWGPCSVPITVSP